MALMVATAITVNYVRTMDITIATVKIVILWNYRPPSSHSHYSKFVGTMDSTKATARPEVLWNYGPHGSHSHSS
jgi:hypothetical protein